MSVKQILVLPRLDVKNANAWSSPYTAGFPAVSAFGGAVHLLQRRLNEKGWPDLELDEFGLISHKFVLRTYRERNNGDFYIVAGANPLKKNGERPRFVPEIKCHMNISLVCVCKFKGNAGRENEDLISAVKTILDNGFRIAGGDVLPLRETPMLTQVGTDSQDKDFRRYIVRKLMPSYVLIERRDLMIKGMEQGQDAMDTLLDHLTVTVSKTKETGETARKRKKRGWIVPISTGYAAVSEIGHATNQRDPDTPHRFAEAVVTLGEFKMLHRMENINSMLWKRCYDKECGLYCYQQNSCEENERDNDFDIYQI